MVNAGAEAARTVASRSDESGAMSKAGADPSGRRDRDAPDRRGEGDREPRSFDFDWRTDKEINRIVGDAHDGTVRPLSENRHRLETFAEELFRAETLDAPDAYAAAGIDWPAGRAMEREESAPGVPRRDGSKCLMLSPAITPRIAPRSPS
jgi:hypothetical protein